MDNARVIHISTSRGQLFRRSALPVLARASIGTYSHSGFLVLALVLIKRKVNDKIISRDRAEFTLKIGELTLISAAGLSDFAAAVSVRAALLVFLFFSF